MTLITEIRKNVSESTPLMAMVGATDYAVERMRAAAGNASTLQVELEKRVHALEKVPAIVEERVKSIDPKAVQQVPALAVARALEAAGRMEQSYEQLAVRGKDLLERVGRQKATQDLLRQGKVTLSRTRAAVTTARKAVDDTAAAALSAVNFGRHQAAETVADVAGSVAATEKVVEERTQATREAAGRTVANGRKRAVTTRAAARGVVTSARKTAEKAVDAVEATAEKIGDGKNAPEKPAE
jgi:heparin binding hemagglutinin HbhA